MRIPGRVRIKKGYADGSNRGVIKPMKIVIKRYSGSVMEKS